MKRYLCWFALVVVIAAPAAAAACWPTWGGRFAYGPRAYGPPAYSMPTYAQQYAQQYSQPPFCIAQPTYPTPATTHRSVLPPPRVESVPSTGSPSAVPSPAPAPGLGSAIPDPMPPLAKPTAAPAIELVRPVGGSDAPPTKADAPTPAPKPAETPRDPDLTYPKVEIPKTMRTDPKLPPLELPKEPDMKLVPKVPAVGAPKDTVIPAIPSAAPPPEPLIPSPSLPLVPDASKRDPLPSLTLPPEIPVAPRRRPIRLRARAHSPAVAARSMTVSVFAARGVEAPAGYRSVGFYNHTGKDLALTIEGRRCQAAGEVLSARAPSAELQLEPRRTRHDPRGRPGGGGRSGCGVSGLRGRNPTVRERVGLPPSLTLRLPNSHPAEQT